VYSNAAPDPQGRAPKGVETAFVMPFVRSFS
jgi:hypothetical protein